MTTGETRGQFTRVDSDHPKTRFRAVFVSLHGDAKRYPGGVTALAHELGVNPVVLADKLNPNIIEKVPTARELLEVFERTHSTATGNALALLIDRTTVSVGCASVSPREVVQLFMSLTRRASEMLAHGAEALEDGRIDADERAALESLVDELVSVAVQFRAFLRSGA